MKTVIWIMAAAVLAGCSSNPSSLSRTTAPLNDPWSVGRPICRDPARPIAVCLEGPGRTPERHCSCMSPNQLGRTGLLQPAGPHSLD
jgi:hypothetical protein